MPVVNKNVARSYWWSSHTTMTDQADDIAAAAPGTNSINFVTGVQVSCAHATTGTVVVIKQGSTIIWRAYVGPADEASSNIVATFDPPLVGAANAAINVANITDASETFVCCQGFTEIVRV